MKTFRTLLCSLLLAGATLVAAAAEMVNINTADASAIASGLNGIGPSKAEAIVAWREANGGFKSVEQLAQVKGVGLRTVEKNRDRISIGATRAPAQPVAKVEARPAD
ncbi:MAG TPA: ComEA family DNA-binding protein [Pseudomonadota bacterium]|nr:ComEA family DNA-binding protein [Xanthomonadales bacterium]HQW63081.1 ComEA family DNA-binding protein [Pseudomonadota bacterium]MBP6691167.1 ComEA family DNA-binding protein [Xanthomonadales bacterium]MBP7418439.1 ComEA family DNA-binding protein [Xanthomonadales bacterium]MBP8176994.1 ComEA family DNA-binding protein [Xanthomonadales bacterium]